MWLSVTFISFRRLFLKDWSPRNKAPFPLNNIRVHFNNPTPLLMHHHSYYWSGYSKFCCSNKITPKVKGLNQELISCSYYMLIVAQWRLFSIHFLKDSGRWRLRHLEATPPGIRRLHRHHGRDRGKLSWVVTGVPLLVAYWQGLVTWPLLTTREAEKYSGSPWIASMQTVSLSQLILRFSMWLSGWQLKVAFLRVLVG